MPETGGALCTDLYELNMLAAYLEHGLTDTAVCSSSLSAACRRAAAF
ncbi:MAG TPA: hypothetical protein VME45_03230 [Stellaceae bacterium]|nr:hypothetical protein [Stellaceae bacterium]